MQRRILVFFFVGIALSFMIVNKSFASQSVVVWSEAGRGSDSVVSNGEMIKVLSANGIKVAVSVKDDGWKMAANVAIINQTKKRIAVDPSVFTMDIVKPIQKSLAYQIPEKLIKSVKTTAGISAFLTGFSGAMATNTTYVNAYGSGGYASATVTTPDYFRQYQSQQQVQSTLQNAKEQVNTIDQSALRTNTILPEKSVAGVVRFARFRKSELLVLRMPVNGVIYEIPFSWEQKKHPVRKRKS